MWMKTRASATRRLRPVRENLEQLALRNGGRYVGVSTSMPLEDVIFGSLVRARGLG